MHFIIIKKRIGFGYVYRNRFLSEPIYKDKYLLNCIAYIHLNPVKANMVDYPWEYKYSRFNDYIGKNGIIDNDTIKMIFGNEDFFELFNFIHFGTYDYLDAELNKIVDENVARRDDLQPIAMIERRSVSGIGHAIVV
jgi:hypothetical protein